MPHLRTRHLVVVVVGQQPFAQRHQHPERALLVAKDEEHRRHNVHRLAVADFGIAQRVRAQHTAQRIDAVGRLECGMLGQRSVQIAFDLILNGLRLGQRL